MLALLGQSRWASEAAQGPGHCRARETQKAQGLLWQDINCPGRPPCAHLWLWGGPKGSGLLSPSVVWRCWQAPGAGTEVAGSPVALCEGCRHQQGHCHQPPPDPYVPCACRKRPMARVVPSYQRPREPPQAGGAQGWGTGSTCCLPPSESLSAPVAKRAAPGSRASRAPTRGHGHSIRPSVATRPQAMVQTWGGSHQGSQLVTCPRSWGWSVSL